MTFNAGDLEEALEELVEDEEFSDEYGDDIWDALSETSAGDSLTVVVNDEPVEVWSVDTSYGSYDGDTYIILEADGRNFRKSGYTASHDGTYFDGSFEEVSPAEKTITVWRTVR